MYAREHAPTVHLRHQQGTEKKRAPKIYYKSTQIYLYYLNLQIDLFMNTFVLILIFKQVHSREYSHHIV